MQDILLILLSGMTGFVISQTLRVRKRPTQVNHNKCLECGDQVPAGFKICMRCYSYKETQEFTAEK